MVGVFLIIWFYLYAGLLFGQVSTAIPLFPGIRGFWQVIGWPIFFSIYFVNRITGK